MTAHTHALVASNNFTLSPHPFRCCVNVAWCPQNSWGVAWGEQGYYKLCKGSGACGINQAVVAGLA